MESVMLSKTYRESLARLDSSFRLKAFTALLQFMEDKTLRGLHFEQLENCRERKMSSFRIEGGFRTILCWRPEQQAYLLLYIDQHDDAYKWAKNKVISVNDETGAITIYGVNDEKPAPAPENTALFPAKIFSDRSLTGLGVPEEQLDLVRSIQDEDQLLELTANDDVFSDAVGERLIRLAAGESPSALRKEVEANKAIADGDPMKNPETLSYITPVDFLFDEPTVKKALEEGTLEDWRVFLHPAQQQVVEERFAGPALVQGAAGTGKTVTALHRARSLSRRMAEEKAEGRILYTFYTVNLAGDIGDNLRSICTSREANRIDVVNIDKLLSDRLKGIPGYQDAKIQFSLHDDKLAKLWEDAIAIADPQLKLLQMWDNAIANGNPQSKLARLRNASIKYGDSPIRRLAKYLFLEWDDIVTENDAFTLEEYLNVKRTGGVIRLSSEQRGEIWKVFDAYRSLMRDKHWFDQKTAMHIYQRYAAEHPDQQYRHIIVDEAQDFSGSAMRLIRALAGPEHEDDIYLVCDPRQQIYDRRVVLSRCGIHVSGRVRKLYRNYRTTELLRRSAVQMLENESFDAMTGETVNSLGDFSCRRGVPPQVKIFGRIEDEAAWIAENVQLLIDSGVPEQNICLAADNRNQVKAYSDMLKELGVNTFKLGNKSDERNKPGIRVGTIHRVKGLEFTYMFIAGLNHGVLPTKDASGSAEILKRDKCLLYVALTRAQKGAYVSGYGKPSEFLTALSAEGSGRNGKESK